MGLIRCSACGSEISGDAASCPKCGHPLKGKKKKGLGCLMTIIVIIVFFGVIGALLSGNESDSGDSTSKDAKTEDVMNINNSEQESGDITFDFGQEGELSKGFTLKVNEVTETDSISAANGTMFYKPDSGKFAIVNITIKNGTKESQSLLLNYFKLIGQDDAEYVSTIIAVADDKFITVDTINPNLDLTGNLVFEIPKDLATQDFRLKYSDFDLFSGVRYFNLK